MSSLPGSIARHWFGTWAVSRRELYAYLVSPMAYAVASVFLLVNGFIFFLILAQGFAEANLKAILPTTAFLLLLVIPVLTMRLVAEERSSGTIELLMTFPLTDAQVVVGKFLATLITYALMLVPTLAYVLIIVIYGATEWGPIMSAYIGLLLLGGAFISLGLFASSLTRNQIVAAIVGIGLLLMLWVLGSGASVLGPRLSPIVGYLSLAEHFQNFGLGVLEVKDVVYYLSVMVGCLFLTTRVLESGRWRA
ncbi:MAG: ABC transporter permease [Proteobacteria bacterium]|jgi:ABC-2 type transport system permease protein|nr:ABC transporter permease [Chloroflexota bacterium]NBQ60944.1 ABC transporter permease [Pseudomonadota bacterium]NBT18521.1 ABC transporter permease [Pseudomonadota bacterium]NBY48045.1 ABC transporter permease [Pseudomonadota bacterium]NCV00310.1 ABC transporter permease [Pseudomonadota bacterium]